MEVSTFVERPLPPPAQPTAVGFDPFAGPEILRLVPLTESQAEIWAACQLGGADASRAYNEAVQLRLTGPLHQPALRRALAAVGQRHEALRAVFAADGRTSCIVRELPIELHVEDLAAVPPAAQAQRLAAYAEQEAHLAFDLINGPLLRAGLLRLAATEHCLVLTVHHLVCDGWSLAVLLQDLSACYSAYCQEQEPDLPAALPFSSYADEELLFGRSPAYQQTESYWLGQYQDAPPVLQLPTDFERPARRTYRSARADYLLPPALVHGLRQVGLREGCTLVITLLAAFEVLLHQLTGQADVVVGLPTAGQAATGHEQLVGHCVHLLPLRSREPATGSFPDYLRRRKPAIFDAYEHQRFTFGSLLKKLRFARDTARVPLVPVVFNIDLGLTSGLDFHSLACQAHSLPRAYETFELFLNAAGSEQALTLEWSYNTDLFRPETIARWMARFEQLLHGIVADPAAALSLAGPPAPALPAAYQVLNATSRTFPDQSTLHELIAGQAARTPHELAVQGCGQTLTYQELDQQANQLAHYLIRQGVRPADTVALAVERSPALLVALLAAMKCGATYVPLDPDYPAGRLAFMLTDAAPVLVLASAPLAAAHPSVPLLLLAEALAQATTCSSEAPAIVVDASALLYVLYTSGSSGRPKGVQVSHRNVVNLLTSMRETPGLTAHDRLLAVSTISFDIAGLELFLPLMCGATVVLADAPATRDGRALLRLLTEENITALQATPATWRLLLDAGLTAAPHLKILCGGEALPPDLAAQLLRVSPSVWNLYGPTETTIWSAVKQVTGSESTVTIGHPIANTQIYVLDEQGRPVAAGAVGELCIAGAGVAQGYRGCPTLTAEKFVPDAFSPVPAARLYRTGDLGRLLPSGELQCLGRLDEQVKIRGYRIEPGEIEHCLRACPDVRDAAVVAPLAPAGHERLLAYVVPTAATSPENAPQQAEAWRHALARQLPAYLLPNEFIIVAALPRTPNGKLDRQALRNQGGAKSVAGPASFAPPRTANEQLVAGIWQECLGLARVGRQANFFELGGHSLTAVQVMARLEAATGIRLPLAALFEQPTVQGLAALLQADGNTLLWSSLVPIRPEGHRPPLYLVHGAGLNVLIFNAVSHGLDADQPVYGLQAQGLNGTDQPHYSVEAMAAHYLAAIVEHNPVGPYALAGYSFGGIIAFEMARQLRAAGKEVKFLGLFDTYAEQPDAMSNGPNSKMAALRTAARRLLYRFTAFKNNPKTTLDLFLESLQQKGVDIVEKFRYNKSERYQRKFGHPYELGVAQEIAKQNYYLTPQPLTVHLFRSSQRLFYLDDFEFMGWKSFALGGVVTHDMPGNHYYIFSPPNDIVSARILQNALNIG